ncbi:YiiX/YebB-like N1pC/P60 family cysteine hydrolase [Clostridium cibarium]|nr:YiiX/YebB-like N1pC/P60 family cysteine hydrolase [Clostridium cibarium]
MLKTKILIITVIFSGIITAETGIFAHASTSKDMNEILSQMPGVTSDELQNSIKDSAKLLGKSEEEISEQIIRELKNQKELGEEEQKSIQQRKIDSKLNKSLENQISRESYTLGPAKYNGDVFYEPASTFSIEYGHVGIYWTADTIVESLPSTGVRSISRNSKSVESGSKIFTFSGVSADVKNVASNWAYGRIGDPYSYNFATNRLTDCYGAKNCSKLVWAAYKETAGLDIDKDGGLGVYPKDILYDSRASIYTEY